MRHLDFPIPHRLWQGAFILDALGELLARPFFQGVTEILAFFLFSAMIVAVIYFVEREIDRAGLA